MKTFATWCMALSMTGCAGGVPLPDPTLHRLHLDARNADEVMHKPAGVAVQGSAVRAVGPLLDSPDDFRVGKIRQEGATVVLEMIHTKIVDAGGGVRRNIPYRPIAEWPVDTLRGAGVAEVEVSWVALRSLPDGASMGTPPLRHRLKLRQAGIKLR